MFPCHPSKEVHKLLCFPGTKQQGFEQGVALLIDNIELKSQSLECDLYSQPIHSMIMTVQMCQTLQMVKVKHIYNTVFSSPT